ncbi:MAG: cysteine desulfurase [marine bacterium B5-7]|nr:MAG: cysteine desulfurase [marine bacterium B5-7]
MLDIDFVRSQYAAFNTGAYAGTAFFENAGGSCIPRQVLMPFSEFLTDYKVQPYAPYAASERAGEVMDQGYATIIEWLGAQPDEITIGPSTTLNTYVLANAMAPSIREGDEIIVTNQDHEANIGCWRRLESRGARIIEWQIDPVSGLLNVDDLAGLLTDRTRLVCFTLCSNIVACVHDIRRITDMVRQAGALSIGDGVSFAPHRLLDVRASGLDFFFFSTYKTFAPHTGVMWGRSEVLSELPAQGHFFNSDLSRYRMNPTGPLHAEIAALSGLRNYFEELYAHHFKDRSANIPSDNFRQRSEAVYDLFHDHEQQLATQLLDFLNQQHGVRIIGKSDVAGGDRASTIAFTSDRVASSDIASRLGEHGIGVSSGHFYAIRCIEALNIDPADGVVRASMVHYNTADEVARLTGALDEILNG